MSNPPTDNLTFEQALAELECVVRDLEDGQTGLEGALARYEAGVRLLKGCYQQLRAAEQRILLLTGEDVDGKPILQAFDHAATAESDKPEVRRRRNKAEDRENLFLTLDELNTYFGTKRALVETHLRAALGTSGDCPAALREAMEYGLLAPGKRLRPLLVILAAEACGSRDTEALPAASAVEMIHAYSLIHDDLPAMDDDDLRRGRPTCHKRFGEAMAILAGDALLTLAFQVLAEGYPASTAAACCRELARGAGAAGMVGGQVEDLAWEKGHDTCRPPAELKDLEAVHSRKTGALFRTCLRLGVLAASGERPGGPDPDAWERLDNYGRCLGHAFQITDDLLDVVSTAERTGKRVHKDAGRGKLTYPGFLGTEESVRRADQLCREAQNHLAPLGPAGDRLAALVQSILNRDR